MRYTDWFPFLSKTKLLFVLLGLQNVRKYVFRSFVSVKIFVRFSFLYINYYYFSSLFSSFMFVSLSTGVMTTIVYSSHFINVTYVNYYSPFLSVVFTLSLLKIYILILYIISCFARKILTFYVLNIKS